MEAQDILQKIHEQAKAPIRYGIIGTLYGIPMHCIHHDTLDICINNTMHSCSFKQGTKNWQYVLIRDSIDIAIAQCWYILAETRLVQL